MRDFDPNYKELPVLAKIGQKIVVFNDKEEILFLRRSQKCSRPGGWDFPGGGIQFGEDPKQGIIREIAEETQLNVFSVEPIEVVSVINGNGEFVIMIGYRGKTLDLIPNLSWEHDAYKWVTKGEALNLELPTIHKRFLNKAFMQKKY